MKIECKKKVKREVEETVELDLKWYWVVRVIRLGSYNNKECIKEYEFAHEPDEQEIADCLVEYVGKKNVFASIVKNYKFVECETE